MKKVILVDGNNLMFRSYYATAYSGSIMRNSEGFPTNGLYGFVNMINKIIHEENPQYMLVAFDIGKTFRHDKYDNYKGGRSETPDELKMQFPVAKELLTKMGIKYLEVVNYEADDIIGTFAKLIDNSDDYEGLIVSSDKDLLQLISDKVYVKLLKSKDYIMMTPEVFRDTYKIAPSRMVDLKGLMGDASDNIPGVKGIGEKTAIKLLGEYSNLENLYDHIDLIKGAVNKKLVSGRDSAFLSRDIATICRNVPVDIGLEDIRFNYEFNDSLRDLYASLGFNSFIRKGQDSSKKKDIDIRVVNSIEEVNGLNINDSVGLYLDLDDSNYHKANVMGIALYNDNVSIYIPYQYMGNLSYIKGSVLVYDSKKLYVSSRWNKFSILNVEMDVMLACYLLNYNVKDDMAFVSNELGYVMDFEKDIRKKSVDERAVSCIKRAKFVYDIVNDLKLKLDGEGLDHLFYDIEMPLAIVLGKMEYEGIRCDSNVLDSMGNEIKLRISELTRDIYMESGEEFNISSPIQLGNVLFEKLGLPHGKKNKKGYSTDEATLNKLRGVKIVDNVLEYRMLTKLYSTYIEGLKKSILGDGKIHTIYQQALTRTGRLSSIEPNLQNIPVRNPYGRKIRKSFVAEKDSVILSSDYSQIELRIFASLAGVDRLISAFINHEDIHSKTASDVYGIPISMVDKNMRRNAKAVNFGIIYGISSYGLASDLGISNKEAKEFIDKYFETYPGIVDYMNKLKEDAKRDGYVKTIMNRKRIIEEIKNPNYMIRSMGERMALNTPIQGSSADILKKAMIEIDKRFKELNLESKMLLQIHDELIFNVKLDEFDIVKDEVRRIMENTISLSVPLEVEVNTGVNLYEAK